MAEAKTEAVGGWFAEPSRENKTATTASVQLVWSIEEEEKEATVA